MPHQHHLHHRRSRSQWRKRRRCHACRGARGSCRRRCVSCHQSHGSWCNRVSRHHRLPHRKIVTGTAIRPNLRDHLCRQAPWGFTKPQISAGADDPYPITFWIFLPSSLEPLFGAVSKDEPHKIPWARSLFYRLTFV